MNLRPVVFFWFAAAAVSLAAQTPPAPAPSQQPPIRVETNFVRVDVYPTKDGKPVQGLKAEDFEVLEDGVVQQIKSFEHIVIAPAGPSETRREPSSQRDMLQQATNPRSRVFVIYLDTWNVNVGGSHNIAEPIIRLLDRIIGPDDLVGIMTTEMAASQVILARKTQVIEDGLRNNWAWGLRHSLQNDNREFAYKACYPALGPKSEDAGRVDSVLATKMIQRKRERASFEAIEDLVLYLGALREERKAVIVITEGWLKFRPDQSMLVPRKTDNYTEHYGPDRIGVDLHGKLTTNENRDTDPSSLGEQQCATDRLRLAMLDNDQFFRDILDEANRMNVSFYPVDPRGLPAFDSPIGPEPPPPVDVDHAILRHRLETLHDMALATDGLAVVGSNDLDKGMQRISDDLTSYYLLGYYSTNTKLDGRFRRLQVRVKQPGVQVRARRGYRAATAEEAAAARAGADTPTPEKTAFNAAMGMLSRIRPDSRFRINAAVQKQGDGGTVWVAGELPNTSTLTDEYALGATADIEVKAGTASATATVTLKSGERGFVVPVKLPAGLVDRVQVRARLTSAGSPVPLTDAIDANPGAQPLAYRRGSSTGNRYLPAADFRFSRTERLRLELPVAAEVKPAGAKILDRAGQTLPIPLTTAERTDAETGQKWIMADLTLAPLAAGDYAIEMTAQTPDGTQQVIAAIRVTR